MKNTGSEYKTIAGTFSSAKGELRLLNVSAGRGGKSYLAWQKVETKLQQVCDYLNQQRKQINSTDIQEIYKLSFEAHYLLVSVHPWAEGNGRMSRLVMNMIQKEFGAIPSIVKKESRAEYIQSLANSQEKDDSSEFLDFMFTHHKNNILQQIKEFISSNKNDTLILTEKEKAVLGLIENDLKITGDSIVEKTGFSRPTVMRAIKSLKEKNILDGSTLKKLAAGKLIND